MSAHTAMVPTLANMPMELFDLMCYSADTTRSLKALRLVSRQLYKMTEIVFAYRTFSDIAFSLKKKDLDYLEGVAQNPKYSDCVHALCIVPSYDMLTAEDTHFREEGQDITQLGRILPRLKNLTSVRVGKELDTATLQAFMNRPGVFDHTDRSPNSRISPLAHGFHVLTHALSTSGKQLQKIRAGFQPYSKNHRNSIDHMVLQVPRTKSDTHFPHLLQRPKMKELDTYLSNLVELDLVLEIRANGTSAHCETYLADLLNQTVSLQSLSLSFPATSCAWLAGLPGVHLPQLTSLSIRKAHLVCATELWEFIARHKNLKTLKLAVIQFKENDPFQGMAECLQSLKLSEIHLQQLTTLRRYTRIMLFGDKLTKHCTTCFKDADAAFFYIEGPGCDHATISIKGEHEIFTALHTRLREGHLLRRLDSGWTGRGV